ncbi:YgaP family membrane protein [Carboxylicivirga sp. RSCT41]|uniref:YgaP family membrane protein n=1 Tax=Carboxylicivirga agarovorans TaxID=3417570 RepID=UPI003D331F04
MQERIVRAVAGTFVLISVLLAIYVNINWLFLAGFVGVNLIQSSITKWCLMTDILTKLGVPK